MNDPTKTRHGQISPRAPGELGTSPGVAIREHFLVPDADHFTYRLDVSSDGGSRCTQGQIEMTFRRLE